MKKSLLFGILLLTFAFACKKDDEPVDPRDQFVGTYSAQTIMSIPALEVNESFVSTYTISKEPTAGKLKIADEDGSAR